MIISKDFYLDYINNYLTVEGIAEGYQITEKKAIEMIKVGKIEHEKETTIKKCLKSNANRLVKEGWESIM